MNDAIPDLLHPNLATQLNRSVILAPSGCLEWTGARSPQGYGLVSMKTYWKYGTRLAHRLAYYCAHGFFPPDGLIIRHTCDNPRCCNPAHLLEGTRADNMRDRDERGRTSRGEKHWKAKLTEADVRTIRSSRETQAALARRFGVTILSIHNIRHRKTWRHVA